MCHLMPLELFLIVFYFIPRKFYISGEEEDIRLLDISKPLLDENRDFFQNNQMEWDDRQGIKRTLTNSTDGFGDP